MVIEGASGRVLVGLMVLLFLRDWRSALVVVLNIPLALCCSVIALWITGQTINVMTLGGLALAIGILVDEATVEVENIHAQMRRTDSVSLAVRLGNAQTAVPRLLAMLCILAVFIPAFFMQGAAKGLFAPLALGGWLCHDRIVHLVEHFRAGRVRVAAAARPAPRKRRGILVRAAARAIRATVVRTGRRALACHGGLTRSLP